MIVLKRQDFPSDESFLEEIKKYNGAPAQAYLNDNAKIHLWGFCFGTCCGTLKFSNLKRKKSFEVHFNQPKLMGTHVPISHFHTIEIDSKPC